MSTDAPGRNLRQSPGGPRPAAGASTIETFTTGPFENNCYVVYPSGGVETPGRPCWIIDASFDPWPMIDRIRQLGLRPELLILTHAHVDHIAGINEVLSAFPGLPVVGHEAEREWLGDPALNLGLPIGLNVTAHGPDRTIGEGDSLTLGGSTWRVFHTPGHSPGSITLYSAADSTAISGDTLFKGSVGRTDFPGCSMAALKQSIRLKLYTLPDTTTILPGHGPSTTIGAERHTNPFVPAG